MPAIIPALITAAATVGSALIGSDASSNAADAQTQAANDSNALQKYIYDTNRSDQAPWRQIGQDAITQLENFTKPGFDLSSWLSSQPGYQFGIDQGVNAIGRSPAAQGSLNSGGTLKALDQFGQNYAQGTLTNVFNRLSDLAGFGQTANQQGLQAGQNYANQVGYNNQFAGQAQANSALAQGQYASGALGGLARVAGNFFNNSGNPYAGAIPLGSDFAQTVPTYTQIAAPNTNGLTTFTPPSF